MKLSILFTNAGYMLAFLCVMTGVFFLVTGANIEATAILVVLETVFLFSMQYFKNRRRQHQ